MKRTDKELKRIFDYEFSINNFPFREVFTQEPFSGYLFEEFKKAEEIRQVWLYREQYYPPEEYNKLSFDSKTRNHLQKIQDEFYDKVRRGTLERKFYSPNINQTPIVKALSEIDYVVELMQKPYFAKDEIQSFVNAIVDNLTSINNIDVAKKIADKIISDNINITRDVYVAISGTESKSDIEKSFDGWDKNKFLFNDRLKKEIGKLHDDNKDLPPELNTQEAIDLFNKLIEKKMAAPNGNLFTWQKSDALLAYFIDCANDYLNLRQSNKRIKWKPFCIAFCIENNKNLRDAVNDYKNKTGSFPIGYKDVDSLF